MYQYFWYPLTRRLTQECPRPLRAEEKQLNEVVNRFDSQSKEISDIFRVLLDSSLKSGKININLLSKWLRLIVISCLEVDENIALGYIKQAIGLMKNSKVKILLNKS